MCEILVAHGPGQLIAYPIPRLADRDLLIRPYVRALEAAMAETAAAYGVSAARRDGLPGLWVAADGPLPRKLGAIGVRVEHGVTYHGIALNVSTDLRDFDLIDPCGLPDIGVTSIAKEAGWRGERKAASADFVAEAAAIFAACLARLLDAELEWAEPTEAGTHRSGGLAEAAGGRR